jgi:hypothetical protein
MRGITNEMASVFDDPGRRAVETVIVTKSEVDDSQKESIALILLMLFFRPPLTRIPSSSEPGRPGAAG